MMKYTEEEIIRCLQTDPSSAEREQGAAMLLEQYAGLLWSVCQRRLQNVEDIKECVNSTFAEVCLYPERYDARKGNLKNYLCMVADRKAIDRYHENERRQQAEESFAQEAQRRAGVVGESVGGTVGGTCTADGDSVTMSAAGGYPSGNDRAADKLEEALEQLDPIDSQILRMKYYDGMTYQEIARQLGLTEGTVKMRSLRSRKKLFKLLIVVLILALLAACAVAVLRRYQFTNSGGFTWSDEVTMYELVEGGYTWETDQVRGWISDASYVVSDGIGELTIYVTAQWLGEEENAENLLREAVNHEFPLWDSSTNAMNTLSSGYYMWFYDKDIYQLEHSMLDYMFQLKDQAIPSKDGIVTYSLSLGEKWIADLKLQRSEYVEYDDSHSKMTLWNGTEWSLGPAIAGNPFTILSIYGSQDADWILASSLMYSRYGSVGTQTEPITLTGNDGSTYNVMRAVYQQNDVERQDENRQFDLYFMGVPAGEYQLQIPLLYYTREWTSEDFTLVLPEEEDVLVPCDVTALFPDGSGYHITGITKHLYEEIQYQQDAGSDEIREEIRYYWLYVLEGEKLSAELPVFQGAAIECVGDSDITYRITETGQIGFRMLQGTEPEEIVLRLVMPEYVVEQDFVMDVTVREAP